MPAFDVPRALTGLGWPPPTLEGPVELARGVRAFQRGTTHVRLLVDGVPGPKTQAALVDALHRREAGKGTASAHFDLDEFRCGCAGRLAGCAGILVHAALVRGLELYRRANGDEPVRIVSGYRCSERNRAAGGATESQHVLGGAVDLEPALTVGRVAALRAFAGIGDQARTGLVRHVDVRHVTGLNRTGGTPDRPSRWQYA